MTRNCIDGIWYSMDDDRTKITSSFTWTQSCNGRKLNLAKDRTPEEIERDKEYNKMRWRKYKEKLRVERRKP